MSLGIDADQAHTHYMLGQCFRFMEKFAPAIDELKVATDQDPNHKEWFLALGIALQLDGRFDESVDALRKANALDPDYALAYNSASVSFRKLGEYEKAVEVYDMGAQAIIRAFVLSAGNRRDREPVQFKHYEGELWLRYTVKALAILAAQDGMDQVAFPTEEMAASELATRHHGGLFWIDQKTERDVSRLYLPNCFDAIRMELASGPGFFHVSREQKPRTRGAWSAR